MRILHVLDHSLPMLDGYAIRSRHVLEGLRAEGVDVAAVTAYMPEVNVPSEEDINGVRYYRTEPARPDGIMTRIPLVREKLRQKWLGRRVREAIEDFQPDLVHCHSPVLYGVKAQVAASNRGLPFVYEVRAFWEDAAEEQGKFGRNSLRYRIVRRMETKLFGKATAVSTISHHLCDEIVQRGVDRKHLVTVPNGVDAERFAPRPRAAKLAEDTGLAGRVVIGYIGSFFGFEGVDLLIEAAERILADVPNAAVMIVGGGKNEDSIRRAAERTGLPPDRLVLTGRVPFDSVIDYYSLVDIAVYPRRSMRLTELVTPLKPLEAMAMGKAVVGSSVGGLEELIRNNRTGLLFESGNCEKFADVCIDLAGDEALREKLGTAARNYILAERQWSDIVRGYTDLYEELLRVR